MNFKSGGIWIQKASIPKPRPTHTGLQRGGVPDLAPENSGSELASGEVASGQVPFPHQLCVAGVS